MKPRPAPRRTAAQALSAALSLAIAAGAAWALYRLSFGFEAWTFEGQRQQLIARGALHAPPTPLRSAFGPAPALWDAQASAPAAYLVDFVYARCPGVCLTLGTEYQQMQRALRSSDVGVRLVSVSFDVEHDDPLALAGMAARFHADPARWTFVVPATPADAQQLLAGLGVIAIADGQGGYVHNGDIHLIDARGRLREVFDFAQWPQALAAARALAAPAP